MYKKCFKVKETNCTIITDKKQAFKAAIQSIIQNREKLEEYVRKHPHYLHSLRPVLVKEGPAVVRLMSEAASLVNVGPMAAVAGVLADLAVNELTENGSETAIVENGGEISAISHGPVHVALAAGDSLLSKSFGFRLTKFPTGVATSSGLFSHALSFGKAEAVTIFAENAGLADAVATAIGNEVTGEDPRKVITKGLKKAMSIQGVSGALIIFNGKVGIGGTIPEIIKLKKDVSPPEIVTQDSQLLYNRL